MPFSIHDASAPLFLRGMTNLQAILAKAEASGIEAADLLEARLAPDMFSLPKQVQSVSDSAKGAMARLAQLDVPSMPDTEATLGELGERLARTIAFIGGIDRAQVDGAEDREIVLKLPQGEMRMSGRDFLTGFALPNFYFHLTTAYALLRHKGVAIGKMDYLGGLPRQASAA